MAKETFQDLQQLPEWRDRLLWLVENRPSSALAMFRNGTLAKALDQVAAQAMLRRAKDAEAGVDPEVTMYTVAEMVAPILPEEEIEDLPMSKANRERLLAWGENLSRQRERIVTITV